MNPTQNNSPDGRPSNVAAPSTGSPKKKGLRRRPRSKLWIVVWIAFALQITAWVFWVKLASKHPVQEVPLVTAQPFAAHLSSDARPTEAQQLEPLEERGRAANNSLNPDAAAQSTTATTRQ